jgi:hypothetical protein
VKKYTHFVSIDDTKGMPYLERDVQNLHHKLKWEVVGIGNIKKNGICKAAVLMNRNSKRRT